MSKNRKRGPGDGAQDYEVGYGKTPTETRFKPGQSGNKKGRPRKKQDLPSLIVDALDRKVIVTEQGKSRKISMKELIARNTVAAAAKGDMRAIKFLVENDKTNGTDIYRGMTHEERIALLESQLDGDPEPPGGR